MGLSALSTRQLEPWFLPQRVPAMTRAVTLPDLAANEAVIEKGMRTFVEVGDALADIRDRHLYVQPTFEAYVKERWGWERSMAYHYINAAVVAANVDSITHLPSVSHGVLLAPLSVERQRELAPAIADLSLREARAYVRAAEAPIEPEAIVDSGKDVSTEYRALMRAMQTVLDLQKEAQEVRIGWSPQQRESLQRRAAQVERMARFIQRPQTGHLVLEVDQ